MASDRDWKTITDAKKKYAAYLCSREWCEKREAVRERARDTCERCRVLPMQACHHLNYTNKYNENLEDLQAICTPCHEFTHGKSDFDPAAYKMWMRYLTWCKSAGKSSVSRSFLYEGVSTAKSKAGALLLSIEAIQDKADLLASVLSNCAPVYSRSVAESLEGMELVAQELEDRAGLYFCYAGWLRCQKPEIPFAYFDKSLEVVGVTEGVEYWPISDGEDE